MCNHPARNRASGMLWKQLEESSLEEVLLQSPQEASFLQVRLGGQGARYFSGGNSSLFPLWSLRAWRLRSEAIWSARHSQSHRLRALGAPLPCWASLTWKSQAVCLPSIRASEPKVFRVGEGIGAHTRQSSGCSNKLVGLWFMLSFSSPNV